jgi:hypothetical protein
MRCAYEKQLPVVLGDLCRGVLDAGGDPELPARRQRGRVLRPVLIKGAHRAPRESPPLAIGSGKLDTPWSRMHVTRASNFVVSAVAGGPQLLPAGLVAGVLVVVDSTLATPGAAVPPPQTANSPPAPKSAATTPNQWSIPRRSTRRALSLFTIGSRGHLATRTSS